LRARGDLSEELDVARLRDDFIRVALQKGTCLDLNERTVRILPVKGPGEVMAFVDESKDIPKLRADPKTT